MEQMGLEPNKPKETTPPPAPKAEVEEPPKLTGRGGDEDEVDFEGGSEDEEDEVGGGGGEAVTTSDASRQEVTGDQKDRSRAQRGRFQPNPRDRRGDRQAARSTNTHVRREVRSEGEATS